PLPGPFRPGRRPVPIRSLRAVIEPVPVRPDSQVRGWFGGGLARAVHEGGSGQEVNFLTGIGGTLKNNRSTHAGFLCLGLALCLSIPAAARAAVFTVISAGDTDDGRCDGSACTLRDAIKAANSSPGADTIQFRIGSGPVAIRPATP